MHSEDDLLKFKESIRTVIEGTSNVANVVAGVRQAAGLQRCHVDFFKGQRSNTNERQQQIKQPLVTSKVCCTYYNPGTHNASDLETVHTHSACRYFYQVHRTSNCVPKKAAAERKLELLGVMESVSGRAEEKKNITITRCRDNQMIS